MNDETDKKATKVTFYADPDVKEWLDSLDSGLKSKAINSILREGHTSKTALDERLVLMEGRIKKLEKENHQDALAIAALRQVLLNRFGENTRAEFKKEYDDLYFGSPRAPRNY